MWLTRKLDQLIDRWNVPTDERIKLLIDQELHGLSQISGMYINLEGRRRVLSLVQIAFACSLMAFHWVLLVYTTKYTVKVNVLMFGSTIHYFILDQVGMIALFTINSARRSITEFFEAMHQGFYNYGEGDDETIIQLKESIRKEKRYLILIPLSVCMAGITVMVLTPLIDINFGWFDFSRTSISINYYLPMSFIQYPFSTQTTLGYSVALTAQLVRSFFIVTILCTLALLFFTMAQNIQLQLKILLHKIDTIEERSSERLKHLATRGLDLRNSNVQIACYKHCLRQCVQHHQVIMRSFELFKETFSAPIFWAYLVGALVIALSVLGVAYGLELPGTVVQSLVHLVAEVGFVFIFSFFGQRIIDLNDQVRVHIYGINWYNYDGDVAATVRVIQAASLRPLMLLAGGMVPTGLDTFSKAMNAAFSYFNLVTAYQNNQ